MICQQQRNVFLAFKFLFRPRYVFVCFWPQHQCVLSTDLCYVRPWIICLKARISSPHWRQPLGKEIPRKYTAPTSNVCLPFLRFIWRNLHFSRIVGKHFSFGISGRTYSCCFDFFTWSFFCIWKVTPFSLIRHQYYGHVIYIYVYQYCGLEIDL